MVPVTGTWYIQEVPRWVPGTTISRPTKPEGKRRPGRRSRWRAVESAVSVVTPWFGAKNEYGTWSNKYPHTIRVSACDDKGTYVHRHAVVLHK